MSAGVRDGCEARSIVVVIMAHFVHHPFTVVFDALVLKFDCGRHLRKQFNTAFGSKVDNLRDPI